MHGIIHYGKATGSTVSLVRPRCNHLLYVYAGLRVNGSVAPVDFIRRSRLLDRNVVMFRDPDERFYQQGVSDPLNSFESFLAWQREYSQALPHVHKLYCLGTSMGGYAALLFGHLLSADEVWAFSPVTSIAQHPLVAGITVPAWREDLGVLMSHWNGTTHYNVYYNEQSSADADAAARVQTCVGVRCYPLNGKGHDVVRALTLSGALDSLLPPP